MSMKGDASKSEPLVKWSLIRVWFKDLARPHDKLCICISPEKNWFYFINSEPPRFRKAQALALSVSRFEVTPLSHDSFIDTTDLVEIPSDGRVAAALADPSRCYGAVSPSLKKRVLVAVRAHQTLTADQRMAVLDGETDDASEERASPSGEAS